MPALFDNAGVMTGPTPTAAVTLLGEVERVTYENEHSGFRVIKVRSGDGAQATSTVVVGTFQAVGPGTHVRVSGSFVVDARHGAQLRAETLVAIAPNTLEGLKKYLGSGVIPGIGPGFAERIVDTFGLETLKVLDEAPERLREVRGLGERRLGSAISAWNQKRVHSNVMLLLQSHGASPALAARICKHYGERAAAVVQRSPYRLALDVRGVGFKTADKIARSLGLSADHPERVQAGVFHQLGVFAERGHLYAPVDDLAAQTAELLQISVDHVQAGIDALWASERVQQDAGRVYLAWLYRAEVELAAGLARLLAFPARPTSKLLESLEQFERTSAISFSSGQRRAVLAAVGEKVSVITGGPGVGKTTIIKAILHVFEADKLSVSLAAPTGRAAKRLSEATGRPATTIHRLLEFDPRSGQFQRSRDNRVDADVVIVDEASMIDVPLAAALVEALADRARCVIVGDADQLPSVGPGAFLRDLIASRVLTTVSLNDVFRQAAQSNIVLNAHRIYRGETPESSNPDDAHGDFFLISRHEPERAAQLVGELVVERIPKKFGLNPLEDIQVLTPSHRGAAGTIALNQLLQGLLNATGSGLKFRDQEFRVGDRVMQMRNDYDQLVFNGDIGRVTRVDVAARRVEVAFDERTASYEDNELEALSLAYATTVHKSQGSEYPAVVVPLLTAHYVMLSRNLLYTAVTRARRLCVVIASAQALKLALAEMRREDRLSGLADRLCQAAASSAESSLPRLI